MKASQHIRHRLLIVRFLEHCVYVRPKDVHMNLYLNRPRFLVLLRGFQSHGLFFLGCLFSLKLVLTVMGGYSHLKQFI